MSGSRLRAYAERHQSAELVFGIGKVLYIKIGFLGELN